MNLRNLSVSGRLALAFAAIIAVFGAAIALGLYRLSSLNDAMSAITNERMAKLVLAEDWITDVNKIMRHAQHADPR